MPGDLKPLPASARKRRELRERGQVVRSPDIVTTAVVGVALFGLMYAGSRIGSGLTRFMVECFTELGKPAGHATPPTGFIMPALSGPLTASVMVFLIAVGFTAVLTNLVQTGPLIVLDRILEQGRQRLNPVNGIKMLFSMRKVVHVSTSIVKLVVITAFSYAAVRELWSSPVFTRPVNVQELGGFFQQAAWAVGWRILFALMVIAVIDYLYQKWQYEKDNRMSLQEMKDEVRQADGSAEVKGRQRGLMRKLRSLRRQLEDMNSATIVVTNPTHYAVALRYEREVTPTPIVVAKGIRLNAQAIKEKAAELGVPTIENVPLARGLFKHGQVGDPIPPLYYQAVALVLADLFRRGFKAAGAGGRN